MPSMNIITKRLRASMKNGEMLVGVIYTSYNCTKNTKQKSYDSDGPANPQSSDISSVPLYFQSQTPYLLHHGVVATVCIQALLPHDAFPPELNTASVAQWIRHRPPISLREERRGLRVRVPPEVRLIFGFV